MDKEAFKLTDELMEEIEQRTAQALLGVVGLYPKIVHGTGNRKLL
jgi:hypothetical protein